MTLLDILVKLRLDKSTFESELKDATNEAEDAGKKIEDAGKKGSNGFGSNLLGKVSAFGSKMGEVGSKVSAVGKGLQEFGRDASLIGGSLTASITKPALSAATAIGKIFLGKGWERMSVITEAKNKLKTLGVEGENLDKTMSIIGDTVDGTAYSTAEFANTAAQAVSMGYDESHGLAGYLQTVANLAAFTGKDVEQISSITAKVASQNKLTGETFQQLSDSAVPILQWIQEEYGVTAEEARKMVSKGEIDFAEYESLVKKHLDGMATAVGDSTLQGALSSTSAYIAKVGEAFLGSEDDANSFAGQLLPLVNSFNDWLIDMSAKASEWGAVVGEVFGAVVEYVKTGKADLDSMSGSAQELFGIIKPFIDAIQKVIDVGKNLVNTLGPDKIAKIVAVALLAGPIISILGGIVGGIGTLITVVGTALSVGGTIVSFIGMLIPAIGGILTAFGPIILIIGAVIAAGVLLYKNWDTIKSKAQSLAKKVSSIFSEIRQAISNKISNAIATVKSAVNTIKQYMSFSGLKKKVADAFTSVKSAVTDKLDAIKEKVSGWIDKIKGMFPFNIGKIFSGKVELPSVSVSSKSDGGAATSMTVREEPFAKAMVQPYMFKRPTEFYAGEAGDEILYGRNALMRDIKDATKSSGDVFNFNMAYDAGNDANDLLRDFARGVQRYRMAGAI